jgi:hypothetical protein
LKFPVTVTVTWLAAFDDCCRLTIAFCDGVQDEETKNEEQCHTLAISGLVWPCLYLLLCVTFVQEDALPTIQRRAIQLIKPSRWLFATDFTTFSF